MLGEWSTVRRQHKDQLKNQRNDFSKMPTDDKISENLSWLILLELKQNHAIFLLRETNQGKQCGCICTNLCYLLSTCSKN